RRFPGRGRAAWDSLAFDWHDFIRFHGFGLFRQRDAQHAFAETRVDLLGIDTFGQVEHPLEGAIVTLAEVIALPFFFLVLFLFAFDDQAAVGQFDLNVFLIHT